MNANFRQGVIKLYGTVLSLATAVALAGSAVASDRARSDPTAPYLAPSSPAASDLPTTVQWQDPSSVRLEVDFPGNGYHASWWLYRCDCGDLLVRSELSEPGEVVHGDALLVANRVVLVRGQEPGAEEQVSFDAPALMMQLALRLLQRVAPEGPAAIAERQEVSVADELNTITLDTGAAVGGFPPPWRASGVLQPAGPGQRRFQLDFHFNTGGAAGGPEQQGRIQLIGVADYNRVEFPLLAGQSLDGWTFSWRDPEDPAGQVQAQPATLAELRDLLASHPQAPAGK